MMVCLLGFSAQAAAEWPQVKHAIILTLENRSFDHYFGALKGTRGFADRNALVLSTGNTDFYQPSGTNYVLPMHVTDPCLADVAHNEGSSVAAWNGGLWDQWIAYKGIGTMAYYDAGDLPFHYALARLYTVCDAYFCSSFGYTMPNRFYQVSGTIDPNGANGGPAVDNSKPVAGYTWTTYPERLQQAGISWRIYEQATDTYDLNPLGYFAQFMQSLPGTPLYDRGMALVTNVVQAFTADVTNGSLPQVSWIIPPWTCSEHPAFPPANGAWFVAQILNVLAANPQVYQSTVLFVTYDENGGFFDHMPSPVAPPGAPDEFVNGHPIGPAVRVPAIIISPWTRGGYICSEVFDHTSLLRFLERWTGVPEPNITAWRRQLCGDLSSAFDFDHPDFTFPVLPTASRLVCTNIFSPSIPSPQIYPIQEPGTAPARPLPYQPNAMLLVDTASSNVWITLTNSGSASVHFSVYANQYRSDGPWRYDVRPGESVADCFVMTNPAAAYDFSCYGPNGFLRRFAGTLQSDLAGTETSSTYDINRGEVSLLLQNVSQTDVTFGLTNLLSSGQVQHFTVPAGFSASHAFCVATNGGEYDLAVTTDVDPLFSRRIAGRLELPPLAISATASQGILQLSYPSWGASYTLEWSTNLARGPWLALTPSLTNSAGRILASQPLTFGTAFFRLRQPTAAP